ncbi:hypothetical protein [Streptomyces sp. WG7]|uniref:hypothetical protein n=1 Tax=Streptomyces sp. WG7 TaxID=3417650 RepID=UPI003CE79D98
MHRQQGRRELLRGVEALEVLPDRVGEGAEVDRPGADLLGPGGLLARRTRGDRASGGKSEFEVAGIHPTIVAVSGSGFAYVLQGDSRKRRRLSSQLRDDAPTVGMSA